MLIIRRQCRKNQKLGHKQTRVKEFLIRQLLLQLPLVILQQKLEVLEMEHIVRRHLNRS